MKLTCFIIFSFSIINVYSIQTLKKYGSLTANEEYISFESDSFSIGEDMYVEIKTEERCGDSLHYEYYNDYDDLQSLLLQIPSYFVRQTSQTSVKVNGKLTSITRYFTIEKKQSEFGSSNGNNLLLYYECTSQYEIENTESNGSTTLIIIIFCVVAVIVIIVIIVYCYRRRARQMMMNRQMSANYVVPYGGGAIYPQQMYPYPYPYPQMPNNPMPNNPMIYQNPQPIHSSPVNIKASNVRIIRNKVQNGEISNNQSSQRIINSQTFEKSQIQQ